MDQILKLASNAGLTQEQGEATTGGIMSLVKKTLGSNDYKKILEKIPEIGGLVTKHEESTRDGGGEGDLMGSLMSSLGSSGGTAGGVAGLLATLQKQGINANEVNKFMPQLASFVQKTCGVDVSSMLGFSASSTTGGDDTQQSQSTTDDIKASVGNVMGSLFGKK